MHTGRLDAPNVGEDRVDHRSLVLVVREPGLLDPAEAGEVVGCLDPRELGAGRVPSVLYLGRDHPRCRERELPTTLARGVIERRTCVVGRQEMHTMPDGAESIENVSQLSSRVVHRASSVQPRERDVRDHPRWMHADHGEEVAERLDPTARTPSDLGVRRLVRGIESGEGLWRQHPCILGRRRVSDNRCA